MKKFYFLFLATFFGLFFCAVSISAQTGGVIDGGVLNGKAISLTKPDIRAAARAVGASGAVNVRVVVDEEGNVTSATALSGHPLLRSGAEKAALASKFSPTILSGAPIKVAGIIVYVFASDGNRVDIAVEKEEVEEAALNGQAVELPSPIYPPAAKAVGASGRVKVNVTLSEKGDVVTATAVSGHPLLREAAVAAAKKAKFDADAIKSNAVATEGTLIYVFFSLPKEKGNQP